MKFQSSLLVAGAYFFTLTGMAHAQTSTSETAQDAPASASQPVAEEQKPTGVSDIVVTATRRASNVQSVPLAITAVGGDDLINAGVTSATELARVAPNLYVLGSAVSAGSPRFTLRGLTGTDLLPTSSPAVATYIDDVYQASQFAIGAGLFDLQRVEVLRGPQGTTFGKNTTGGAVAYFSQVPMMRHEGYVTARVAGGDRDEQFVEGAVNVPLNEDTLAIRASVRIEHKNDYVRDIASGRDRGGLNSQSGRIQLRWTPLDTVVNLTAYRSRQRSDTNLGRVQFFPGPVDKDTVDFSPYNDLADDFDNSAVTLRIERKLGSFDLTSITHYRDSHIHQTQDLDASSFDAFYYVSDVNAEQYGQEFRLASDVSKPISGLVGFYFEKDKLREIQTEAATFNGPAFDFNNPGDITTRTTTYAVFGNITGKITDALSVTAGLRKSFETKRQNGIKTYYQDGNIDWSEEDLFLDPGLPATQVLPFNLRQKSRPWTWDATVNFNPDSSFLAFARVARGFRSGGFNAPAAIFPGTFVPPLAVAAPAPYAGETVQSYEVGVKTQWFDNRLRLNATAYHYDYEDQQVSVFDQGFILTSNAGVSKVDGVEVELSAAPVERLELSASASYNDARYKTYLDPFSNSDYSGNTLIQAPKFSANWSASYTLPVSEKFELRSGTNWSYRSAIFFDAANSDALRAPRLLTGNVRLALEPTSGKGPSIAAFVNNLTNKRPLAAGFIFFGNQYGKFFETGISYGVDVSFRW